jgi:hypothetical protein
VSCERLNNSQLEGPLLMAEVIAVLYARMKPGVLGTFSNAYGDGTQTLSASQGHQR